jgi:acyl-CoA synthetase (AMP-forming)/AMP-acid ligase II
MSGRPRTYRALTIADGVRAAAGRSPGKVALQEGERTLTYAELVARINRVGNGVRGGLGLAEGGHAAILSPNCLEFVEVVLGLASADVPPAMVNPRATAAEVELICDDAQARVLFVHPSLEELARSCRLETVRELIVLGEPYERWLATASAAPLELPLEEWDVFSIPYTAGTTGRPKGVLLSHRSRVLTFFAMGIEYGCYSPDDRALAIAPLFHGAGLAFALAPIFFGGYCAILPRFDAEQVLAKLADLRITNAFMVPAHFHALFELGDDRLRRFDTSALRALISNAAPLAQVMKERIVGHFGDGLLFECYGSTEGGIVSNLRPPDQLRKVQSVGLPFACTEVRLLDDSGADVAPGEVGELFGRSPYLFNGYWQRPEETAAALRDGWFSPGDLARRDDDGYLYLVDRKDDRIVTGGVNVYPREVEEALLRHPAVAEAAVFGIPDERWGEAVRAAVALRPRATASDAELVEFCAARIARYKLPKSIEFLPRIPRNASGKTLRRELREPYWQGRERRIS